MSNEIVKYDNELNTVPFRRFSAIEMNLFFSIISRMRNKGTDEVRFSFKKLKDLSKYKSTAKTRFIQDLKKTYNKMLTLTVFKEDKHKYIKWILFDEFEIDKDNDYISISINPKLKYILNELTTWTRFSLLQFNTLKSSYSKTMFRLTKQYRTVGKRYIPLNQFKEQLDVPKSYNTSAIQNRVITPIVKELSLIFPGFKIKKDKKGKGHKIIGFWISWKAESRNQNDFKKNSWDELQKKIRNITASTNFNQKDKKTMVDALYNQYGYKNPKKLEKKMDKKNISLTQKLRKTSNKKAQEILDNFKNNYNN